MLFVFIAVGLRLASIVYIPPAGAQAFTVIVVVEILILLARFADNTSSIFISYAGCQACAAFSIEVLVLSADRSRHTLRIYDVEARNTGTFLVQSHGIWCTLLKTSLFILKKSFIANARTLLVNLIGTTWPDTVTIC